MSVAADRDDTAHGKAHNPLKGNESSKAGLPMEGVPMTSDPDGKLTAMPTYRTDIGKGTWYFAAYHLSTTIATPAAYAPLPSALAALTWPGGLICLFAGICVTYYCSLLLSSLNEWNGIRYYRYRDLTASIYGRPGYWATLVMQQIASIGNNITIQIVAGISAKAIAELYNPNNKISLQEFIIMFGAIELILSQLPDIHTLRWVNALATFCTLTFTIIATVMSIYQGHHMDRSTVSYSVITEYETFSIFAALGTIAFSFGDTILPEIQATVREPVKKEMYKGCTLAYTIIGSTYTMVAVSGFWAFGNTVNAYLLNSLVGTSPSWPVTIANVCAIIQVIGCYQIYCRPTYEPIDTLVMRHHEGPMSRYNMLMRFITTLTYVVLITFIACMVPFFGDFVALCGAIGFTPIDFILPVLLYNKVRNPGFLQKWLNYSIAGVYFCVAIVGAIGAIRFIALAASTFSVFANLD